MPKKTTAATPAKQSKPTRTNAVLTHGAVVISLSASHQKRAQQCLKESGKITLGLKELSVTRLGQIVDALVIVN
ncbi:MAG: hypothetical protein AABO41_11375 [Acidobacteriota bacterium]